MNEQRMDGGKKNIEIRADDPRLTAYALGDYRGAEKAYRSALDAEPENAAIWNNLAYALAAQGRREDSLAAIRRAIELEPDNANFADSFDELSKAR